ncbi:DUF262 domain-containing HNH endonuclease family protein [Bradyrhizobium sp. Ash2021]|uniref:DUF262 domain-containing protein n=1 Tax=Bradyrhizobium sp. Ash2021 TaxID=2954771 RepID=UPI002815EE1D|nr:DUF262 domain-containing HNH endonuclease family protein [Bradyrhizobium sp. Ash2021]WMT73467.1 DUF262 domain-containing HNH endonuclease family protein [Bradyrhizobium sp. Ash2021]
MISANQHAVADVLGDTFVHEIPPYQRPYAWLPEHALQLFEDLREAMQSGDGEPYFLGSIVLIKPHGQVIGQVVDGQQRLTTLTILAAVLRDAATEQQERDALGATVYIEPNPFMDQVEAVRVIAHVEDRVFFREAIQVPGATAKTEPPHKPKNESQRLMWENAVKLRASVSSLNDVDRQLIVKFLLRRCVLVVVSTESRAAALRIFRVLNDRGLDLSNADVIKADLLSKVAPAEIAHQAARWREFEADLGREEFEGLLENLRFIREETKNRRSLSEAYEERFKGASSAEVKKFLDDELAPAKRWIAEILDGDGEDFPESLRRDGMEALSGLRLLPNRDWMPLALAAATKFGSSERLIFVLTKLEGLAWMMQLARRYDTQRLNRYAEIIRALRGLDAKLDACLTPTAEENEDAWLALSGPIYSRFPVRVVRAILERLDRLLAEQPVVWEGQKTVEHILPQNPEKGEWIEFDQARRSAVTDTIGNLVLLTSRKNSSASNAPFAEKKKIYSGQGNTAAGKKRATYASAQELVGLPRWDLDACEQRQKRHLSLLAEQWGIKEVSMSPARAAARDVVAELIASRPL